MTPCWDLNRTFLTDPGNSFHCPSMDAHHPALARCPWLLQNSWRWGQHWRPSWLQGCWGPPLAPPWPPSWPSCSWAAWRRRERQCQPSRSTNYWHNQRQRQSWEHRWWIQRSFKICSLPSLPDHHWVVDHVVWCPVLFAIYQHLSLIRFNLYFPYFPTWIVLKGKFFCKLSPVAEMTKSASTVSPFFISIPLSLVVSDTLVF